MKSIGKILILVGIILIGIFSYQFYKMENNEKHALTEANQRINMDDEKENHIENSSEEEASDNFKTNKGESFATLEIPKLDKTLPVVSGTDPDSLDKGVGHLNNSVFPGQGEQIVLSGHRDTVFREFGNLEIGDEFTVNMPYGTYTYEIRETEIVPEDDTSVIREMGEEVLVVTTCYPFHYVGSAPERFVTYAYPINEESAN
ncbi:class D sortase [Virgibacillus sp. NKC19-3]|uniref:class D sortase n=1 Tax=Virgibacillus saliphilus TaxID=2831674 RepID=UPI001C9BB909|nr:class D sortase [Virgibacillus sp. NKC19-3]MBY7141563.1 class D sortase [Virgibacillus sp. NKC19-3]